MAFYKQFNMKLSTFVAALSSAALCCLAASTARASNSNLSSMPSTYSGFGQNLTTGFHYLQAVRIGPFVRAIGQGVWDESGNLIPNLQTQIETTFNNINTALKTTRSNGLANVISLRSFHMGDAAAALPIMVSTVEARLGASLEPTWTALRVAHFACTG